MKIEIYCRNNYQIDSCFMCFINKSFSKSVTVKSYWFGGCVTSKRNIKRLET
jgi:hypothetical protein